MEVIIIAELNVKIEFTVNENCVSYFITNIAWHTQETETHNKETDFWISYAGESKTIGLAKVDALKELSDHYLEYVENWDL